MELLAPAGSYENLIAAVASGADAVYLGLDALNARAKAVNFNAENLFGAVRVAHLHGVKVHVALNTLLKNSEKDLAIELLKAVEKSGADAIIIADLGMLELAKRFAPSPAYHASTQMGIHNAEGAEFVRKLGFSRAVLARETRIDDIKAIKSSVDIELEYFVHGALCVSFSGNCYLSSLACGNSGNRGRCLQFCRKKYLNTLDNENNFALSLKDQCLIDEISALKKLGVDSVKIEGRLKSRAYVASVTSAYRKAIDGRKITDNDIYAMSVAFNRGGFTEGYAFGDPENIVYPTLQSNYGFRACKIISVKKIQNKYILRVNDSSRLKDGQGIKIIGEDGTEKGGFTVKTDSGGIISDKPYDGFIYITSEPDDGKIEMPKIGVKAVFIGHIGDKPVLELTANGISVQSVGEYVVAQAKNRPNTREELLRQLSKFNDTEFLPHIELNVGQNIYVPNGVLANMRRAAAAALEQAILDKYDSSRTEKVIAENPKFNYKSGNIKSFVLEITAVQIDELVALNLSDFTEIVSQIADYSKIRRYLSKNRTIYLKLPVFASGNSIAQIRKFIENALENRESVGIYAQNYYALALADRYSLPVIAGFTLNIANDAAAKVLNMTNFCMSVELAPQENAYGGICYAFGNFPVMTLLHCPVQNALKRGCDNCGYKPFAYRSEHGEFRVVREKLSECVFTVKNSAVHNLLSSPYGIKYLDLTDSSDATGVLKAALENKDYRVPNATKGAKVGKLL